MATLTYTVGDTAVETATFKVSGTLTDPTTVTASVVSPSGVVTNPTPAHPSTGTYTVSIDLTEAGDWFVRIVGTGAAKGAKETFLTVRRSEVPGSNLIAEALVTVGDMRFFLDRQNLTADMDETRWLEDLINEYSLIIARYCNRQFTPERTAPGTRWPLKSDPVATGVAKTFTYDGNGYLSLAPYEPRTVTTVIMGVDLPTAQQVTLQNQDATHEAEYRLEPAQKKLEGTYWWIVLPTASSSRIPWRSIAGLGLAKRQVQITGDWGAPAGLIPHDVQRVCKEEVGRAFRNPENFNRRTEAGMDIELGTNPAEAGGALSYDSLKLLTPHVRR